MTHRHVTSALLFSLALTHQAWGQTYSLSETARVGDCFRIQMQMSLSGEIRISKNGAAEALPLKATAVHDFAERTLSVDAAHVPNKSARAYDKAETAITVHGETSKRVLRPERRLCVAQRYKDDAVLYSPAGMLTREELELTAEQFDTLSLLGLLPAQRVPVGQTWKVANTVAQALCGFEGLTEQNLVCKLESVTGQVAHVTISGTASGIDLGAMAKLTIDAAYDYSLDKKRLTRLQWKQKDNRDQGPASPATSIESTTTLTRAAIDVPETLSDVALVGVPDGFEPPPGLLQLEYRDPRGRFSLLHAREWHTVSQSEEHLVMRLMERGDFVAQVTVTPWTKAEKGTHLTPVEFREAMSKTQGWQPEEELQAAEVPTDGGRWIYRISTTGQLDGVKVMQNFYLVASPNGDQVVLAFTMSPKQADRLGTRDISLAANLDFPHAR
jgi:hypothetical protein